ncbi:hypothetical protein SMICM304S_03402 [Streptomyces microflavus]
MTWRSGPAVQVAEQALIEFEIAVETFRWHFSGCTKKLGPCTRASTSWTRRSPRRGPEDR